MVGEKPATMVRCSFGLFGSPAVDGIYYVSYLVAA